MKRFKTAAKKGFTLAEMLIVVAILAILTAVAAPNVAKYSKGIKLRELDDSARAIYMAAQHEFKAKVAMGKELTADDLIDTPPRYTEDGAESIEKISYTLHSKDIPNGDIISTGAIESELAANNYVIEFNAETGDVYGVFYSVDPNEFEHYSDEYNNPAGKYAAAVSKSADRVATLGYYGLENEAIAPPPSSAEVPSPIVEIINREKLVLKVTAPNFSNKENKAYIAIDICAANDKDKIVHLVPRDGVHYMSPNGKADVILDSLEPSVHAISNELAGKAYEENFSSWADGSIAPGAMLDISVTFYDPKGVAIDRTVKVTANSLFADGSDPTEAHIQYGRHLQNLGVPGASTSVKTVKIDKTIDFKAPGDGKEYDSWDNVYGYAKKFKAVTTSAISISAAHGAQIKYLNAEGGGIFNTLTSANVNGIEVVNPNVVGENSGAIAAEASGGSFKNCCSYVENSSGESWTDLEKNPYKSYTINGTGTAGGLVGKAKNVSFNQCSSSVKVKVTGGTAGGLIGSANNGTVTDCAVLGHTYSGKFEGKTAEGKDVNLKDNVSGSTAGGIIGKADGTVEFIGTVFSSCSSRSVSGTNANPICPDYDNIKVISGDQVYTLGKAYDLSGTEIKITLPANALNADSAPAGAHLGYRYDCDNNVSPIFRYSAPDGVTLRGDWPSSDTSSGFFYWEKEGENYNIYAIMNGVETGEICKKRDGNVISEYGYGAFSSGSIGTVSFKQGVDNVSMTELTDETTMEKIKAALSLNGLATNSVILYSGDAQGFVTATFDGASYTFAPDFYALYPNTPKDDTLVYYGVRCKAHLENVGKYLGENSAAFVQSHDIKPGKIAPIGSKGNPFTGSYDGGSYRIIDAQIIAKDGDYAGLFGATEDAELKNIVLFHPAEAASDFVALTVKESGLSTVRSMNPVGISAINGAMMNESLAAVDGHYSATVATKKVEGWILDAGQSHQRQVYEVFAPGSNAAKLFIETVRKACKQNQVLTMVADKGLGFNLQIEFIIGTQYSQHIKLQQKYEPTGLVLTIPDWLIWNFDFDVESSGVYIAGTFDDTPTITIEFPDTIGDSGVTTNPVDPATCDHNYTWKHIDNTYHEGNCLKCSNIIKEEHSFDGTWRHDDNQHWRFCSKCGAQYDYVKHNGDSTWTTDPMTDPSLHWHHCSICNTDYGKTTHNFPKGSTVCEICKYDMGDSGSGSNGGDSGEPGGDVQTSPAKVGGIVGKADGGRISNCVVAGYTLIGTDCVGGIAGESTADISCCEANVKFGKISGGMVGGIVGSGSTVQDCYALVHGIDGSGDSVTLGGIAGNVDGTVNNCYVIFSGQTFGMPVANGTVNKCMYITDEGYYQSDKTGETGVALKDLSCDAPFGTANATYAASATEPAAPYPYPAVFKADSIEHYGPVPEEKVSKKGDLTVGPIVGVYHLREYQVNNSDEHTYQFDGYYSYNKDSVLYTSEFSKFHDESLYRPSSHGNRWYQGRDYIGVFTEKDFKIVDSKIEIWVNDTKLDNAKLKKIRDAYNITAEKFIRSGAVTFKDRNGIDDLYTHNGEGNGSGVNYDILERFDFYVLYYDSGEEVKLGRNDVISIYNTPEDGPYAGKRGTLFTARGGSYSLHGYSFAGEVPHSDFDESDTPIVGSFIVMKRDPSEEKYYAAGVLNNEPIQSDGSAGWGSHDAKVGIIIEKSRIDDITSGRLKIALDKVFVNVLPWDQVVTGGSIVNDFKLDYNKYALYVIVDDQNTLINGPIVNGAHINGIINNNYDINFVYGSNLFSAVHHDGSKTNDQTYLTSLTQSDVNNIFTDPEPLTPMVGLYALYSSKYENRYNFVGIRDKYTAENYFDNNKNIRSVPEDCSKTGTYGICFVQDPIVDPESDLVTVTLTKNGTNESVKLNIVNNAFTFADGDWYTADPAGGKLAYDYYILSEPEGWEIEDDDTITVTWNGNELMKCTAAQVCQS